LFDQTFVNAHAQTRRPWTVAISLVLQTALVAIALIAPLLHVASLDVPTKIPLRIPVQSVDLKAKPEVKAAPHPLSRATRPVLNLAVLRAPVTIPPHVDLSPDPPEIASNAAVGPSLAMSGLPGGIFTEQAPPVPPKPAVKPNPPSPPPSAPVRVGIGVQAAKLIFGPKPAYPPLARTTRTQGTVKIQAVISRDGAIKNLQVLGGPPLLIPAAIDAVHRWRYQPTLLNGEPVEVITEIDVNFTLS
jgi:protein TonB